MSEATQKQLDKITGGVAVTIDEKKLGLEGMRLLGAVDFATRAVEMFTAYRNRSALMDERRVLSQVVEGLQEGLDDATLRLSQYALKRGAAQTYDVPHVEQVGEASPVEGGEQ
jgi:hypothetical protein